MGLTRLYPSYTCTECAALPARQLGHGRLCLLRRSRLLSCFTLGVVPHAHPSAMATRTSFRPRPLDLSKPLPIVRDVRELDNAENLASREASANQQAPDKQSEEVRRSLWAMKVEKLPLLRV